MKARYIISTASALACVAAYATFVNPFDKSKVPGLALPAAYEIAAKALGSDTNKFHCISACISTQPEISINGGWQFTYYSTNTPPVEKYVTVEFNGKPHVEDDPIHIGNY